MADAAVDAATNGQVAGPVGVVELAVAEPVGGTVGGAEQQWDAGAGRDRELSLGDVLEGEDDLFARITLRDQLFRDRNFDTGQWHIYAESQ